MGTTTSHSTPDVAQQMLSRIFVSASDASANAAQDSIWFCCCSSTLLAYIQLVVHQDPQVPLSKADPQAQRSWPALSSSVMLCQVQDFGLVFVKLHTVLASPPFQLDQVFL